MKKVNRMKSFLAVSVATSCLMFNTPATTEAAAVFSPISQVGTTINQVDSTIRSGERAVSTVESLGKRLGITKSHDAVNQKESRKAEKADKNVKAKRSLQRFGDEEEATTLQKANRVKLAQAKFEERQDILFYWFNEDGSEQTGTINQCSQSRAHDFLLEHMSKNGVIVFSQEDSMQMLEGFETEELTIGDIPQWLVDGMVKNGWKSIWAYRVNNASTLRIVNDSKTAETERLSIQNDKLERAESDEQRLGNMDVLDVQYGQAFMMNEDDDGMIVFKDQKEIERFAKKQMPNGISVIVAPRSHVQDVYMMWQTAAQELGRKAQENKAGHTYQLSQLGDLSVLTKDQLAKAVHAFGASPEQLAVFKVNRQKAKFSLFEKVATFSAKVNDVVDLGSKVYNVGRGKWKQALGIYDYGW